MVSNSTVHGEPRAISRIEAFALSQTYSGLTPLAKWLSPFRRELCLPRGRTTGGTYNFYFFYLVLVWVLALVGKRIHVAWPCVWTLFVGIAFAVDHHRFKWKLNFLAMPTHLYHYAHLLLLLVARNFRSLLVLTALYGVVKPFSRLYDPFEAYAFVCLYGLYLVVRTPVFIRLMLRVRRGWEQDTLPPFEVKKANFSSKDAATRHLVWSYFLGNVGVTVRCASYATYTTLLDGIWKALGGFPQVSTATTTGTVIVAGAVLLTIATLHSNHIFYDSHRAFHRNQPLFDSVHRIHHQATYPTPLDSGTESPGELLLTQATIVSMHILPSWFFLACESLFMLGHFGSHTAGTKDLVSENHLGHHVVYTGGFGQLFEDVQQGTYRGAGLASQPQVAASSPR